MGYLLLRFRILCVDRPVCYRRGLISKLQILPEGTQKSTLQAQVLEIPTQDAVYDAEVNVHFAVDSHVLLSQVVDVDEPDASRTALLNGTKRQSIAHVTQPAAERRQTLVLSERPGASWSNVVTCAHLTPCLYV